VATPPTGDDVKRTVEPLTELNSASWIMAPWISADGLRLYYESQISGENAVGCFMASRLDPSRTFGAAALLTTLRHPTLSGDELDLVGIATGVGGPLLSCRRASGDADFPTPKPIAELADQLNPRSPYLSADGLTLVFQRTNGDRVELVTCTRPSRGDAWSSPQPIAGLNQVDLASTPPTWPFLSDDKLTLWFGHGGNRETQVWRATRASLQEPFGEFQPFLVDGMPLVGRSPRYCPATGELFFARPVGKNDWELAVVRGLR
jgi:hypothetical protein